MCEMPQGHGRVMPDFGQARIHKSPCQIIWSANEALVRVMFIETAEADRVYPPNGNACSDIRPQLLPLKSGKAINVDQIIRIFRIRPPLIVHQNERLGLTLGELKGINDGFNEISRKDGVAVADSDNLPSRLQQTRIISLMFVVGAFLTAGDQNVGFIEHLWNDTIEQLHPNQLILVSRYGLPIKPIQSMKSLAARPVQENDRDRRRRLTFVVFVNSHLLS